MNEKTTAKSLANFIIYLRALYALGNINLSDTRLAYAISNYLDVDFDTASKAINDALKEHNEQR